MPQSQTEEIQDIGAFLMNKKDACDLDGNAAIRVRRRRQQFELAVQLGILHGRRWSEDQLSNLGPRFGKLADMYGEDPSESESSMDDNIGWSFF